MSHQPPFGFVDASPDDGEDRERRATAYFLTENIQRQSYNSTPSSSASSCSCSSSCANHPRARPLLLHTLTMSSGSSGADTYSSMSSSDNQSSSEPSTEQELETPPETPGVELDNSQDGEEVNVDNTPVLNRLWSSRVATSFQPASLRVRSTLQNEDMGYDSGAEEEPMRGLGIVEFGSGGGPDEGGRVSGWKRGRPTRKVTERAANPLQASRGHQSSPNSTTESKNELGFEEVDASRCVDEGVAHNNLPAVKSLRRARRPPPLDLSLFELRKDSAVGVAAKGKLQFSSGTLDHPHSAPMENTWRPGLSEADLLPPMPPTAPLPVIPKAPRVRPLIEYGRSPSPLMLPSPDLRGMLTSTPSTATRTYTPSLGSSPSLTQSPHSRPCITSSPSLPSTRASLTQKIANLRRTSLNAPVPPSLLSSPRMAHVKTPTEPNSPTLCSSPKSPISRGSLHSPKPALATPLKRYMNPYFGGALIPDAYNGLNLPEHEMAAAVAVSGRSAGGENISSPPLYGPFPGSYLD